MAAQVEPPLLDKEMVATFVNTLHSPFYEHVLGNMSSNFADIIIIGEIIEIELKSGKIAYGPFAAATPKKPNFIPGKKKKAEVQVASVMLVWESRAPNNYRPHLNQPPYVANAVFVHQTRPQQQGFYQLSNLYQPQHAPNNVWKIEPNSNFNRNAGQNSNLRRNQERNFVHFTPIPMSYTKLLPYLLQKRLVAICLMKPVQPLFPKNYDPNVKCDYHGGGVGHSTENYVSLKHKVDALINSEWIKFNEDKPSIEANPFFGLGNPSTNAIEVRKH